MSSVSRVTEISVVSDVGFDDAVRLGIERAAQTLRGVTSARVVAQEVQIRDGKPVGYPRICAITIARVNAIITPTVSHDATLNQRELM